MSGCEVLVRRGDDPRVHADALRPAEPLEAGLLDDAQELGLDLQGHVADLVQEQRPAVGELELAPLPLHGAGESAPLVAEQLAQQQALGEGRAVDGHERPVPARAGEVDVRASTSLPVPLSPVISTVTGVSFTLSAVADQRPHRGVVCHEVMGQERRHSSSRR